MAINDYTPVVVSNSTWPYDDWTGVGTSNTFSYTYTREVYYYQISCPKCGRLNWGEVDKIITCKGKVQARNNRRVACGARIKAVLEQVDFEVPVEKP